MIKIDLEGDNIADVHKQIAEKFIQKFQDDPNIIGAVLLGGAARGFADEFSDIDLAIFVKDKNKCRLKDGERKWKGFDIDLILIDLSNARKWEWTQVQRWTYSEGIILLDKKGVVQKLLKDKVKMTKAERRKLIVEKIMLLGWLGISCEERRWKDYAFFRPSDLWIKRGHPICAHELLNHCIEICLDLLFLCNKRFIPDEKWKFYLSFKLEWLPDNYDSLIKNALKVARFDKKEFYRRLESLKLIFKLIVQKLEMEGILPKKIYRFLLKYGEYYSTV
jgi:predicted nucleotidyltransferase